MKVDEVQFRSLSLSSLLPNTVHDNNKETNSMSFSLFLFHKATFLVYERASATWPPEGSPVELGFVCEQRERAE
jgi:hypothetical protein